MNLDIYQNSTNSSCLWYYSSCEKDTKIVHELYSKIIMLARVYQAMR